MNSFDSIVDRQNTGCEKWDTLLKVFGASDVLPLWVADMDFPAAPGIIDAIEKRARHPVYGYHIGRKALYQAAIDWTYRRHGWVVKPEWMTNAPGVVSSVRIAILALTEPGDKIIIQPPVYPPFFSSISKNKREIIENPLKSVQGRYEMDFEDLEKKITPATKMFILCSPHNPVGRVWTRQELFRLAEICNRHNITILSDEIHCDLMLGGSKHIPLATIGGETAHNTLTFISPSKTFNIAGMYTSLIIIPDPVKRAKYRELLEALDLHEGNLFGFVASEAAYRTGESWFDELMPYLEKNADYLVDFIRQNVPQIEVQKPEGTYLAWLDFRSLFPGAKELHQFLVQKAKLGLSNGEDFGTQGQGFARLNFACPRKLLTQGLHQLAEALATEKY